MHWYVSCLWLCAANLVKSWNFFSNINTFLLPFLSLFPSQINGQIYHFLFLCRRRTAQVIYIFAQIRDGMLLNVALCACVLRALNMPIICSASTLWPLAYSVCFNRASWTQTCFISWFMLKFYKLINLSKLITKKVSCCCQCIKVTCVRFWPEHLSQHLSHQSGLSVFLWKCKTSSTQGLKWAWIWKVSASKLTTGDFKSRHMMSSTHNRRQCLLLQKTKNMEA